MADWRICGKCGAEYRADRGHTCEKSDLDSIARESRADDEVRQREGKPERPDPARSNDPAQH